MMKLSETIVSLAIIITICTCHAAFAGGPFCPSSKAQASDQNQKMATYTVPDMDTAVVHKIAEAIAAQPGVSLATPDLENKQFSVVYDSSKLEPDKLSEAITSVSPDSKLVNISAAPGPATPSKLPGRLGPAARFSRPVRLDSMRTGFRGGRAHRGNIVKEREY